MTTEQAFKKLTEIRGWYALCGFESAKKAGTLKSAILHIIKSKEKKEVEMQKILSVATITPTSKTKMFKHIPSSWIEVKIGKPKNKK